MITGSEEGREQEEESCPQPKESLIAKGKEKVTIPLIETVSCKCDVQDNEVTFVIQERYRALSLATERLDDTPLVGDSIGKCNVGVRGVTRILR